MTELWLTCQAKIMPWPYVPLLCDPCGVQKRRHDDLCTGLRPLPWLEYLGLSQGLLRRYCFISREHETASSHSETSDRHDML